MPSIEPLATFTPQINSRAWSSTPHPHLPIIATACSDKTVRIYSTGTFAQQSSITGGHKRSIRSCAWKPNSPNESVLVTGSFDASAGIWRRLEDGATKVHPVEIDYTTSLDQDDNRGHGEHDDDDDEWRFAVVLDGHDSEIKSVAFSPVAPLLATCSRDKSVWIWEELEDDNFETVAVLQEHEGDVKCVAWHPNEQLLASASYDDNVRLWREDDDDWACCTLLTGHDGTAWWVEFEGTDQDITLRQSSLLEDQQAALDHRKRAGPRLMTCSDDRTIRVWQRTPKETDNKLGGQSRMPSIWKNTNFEETWTEESRLPLVHDRAVYAVSWSRKTGRVASCGDDGRIAVYEERWVSGDQTDANGDVKMDSPDSGNVAEEQTAAAQQSSRHLTEWVVVAVFENAHDVFEVNHIVWAPRADKAKRQDDEEILISTGDDGEVKAWIFNG